MTCLRCVAFSLLAINSAAAAEKPNIVLLFIDDCAWNGSPVAMDDLLPNSRMPVLQMPNVERLAREGMKFTNAYASPQCSPSRVCVQTGRSSPRNGFTVYMNDRGQEYYDAKGYPDYPVIPCVSDMTIDPDAVTIPEALAPLGYVHYRSGMPHSAVVSGNHKLLHFYDRPDIPMLFDLLKDRGEVNNIANNHSAEHKRLYDEMMGYFEKVGARIPKQNPDSDPDVYQQTIEYAKRVAWGPFEGRRKLDDDEK